MKRLLLCSIVIVQLLCQVNAKGSEKTLTIHSDSLLRYTRFEFNKPYIGWEIGGPSNLLALSYQQQFMRLNKKLFLDAQLQLNNLNFFIHNILVYDPEGYYEMDNFGIYKLVLYLTCRYKPAKWFQLEFSTGSLSFHDWNFKFGSTPTFFKNNYRMYPIFKPSLFILPFRNAGIKFNVNYVILNDTTVIPAFIPVSNFNFSVSLLFGFNKKDEKLDREKIYNYKRNQLFFNFTKMQVGYEHFFLNRSDYNVSSSIAFHAIPFKRFGIYSYRIGWETLTDVMTNFNYSLGKNTYSFVGFGGYLNHVSFYVLNDKFNMYAYGIRSNVGLAFRLSDRLSLKFAYAPYVAKKINIGIEKMNHFLFFRIYRLNAMLSYSF